MSKYKLTPQEYRQLLTRVELDNIALVETKSKYSESSFDNEIDISIKETSKYNIDNGLLKVYLICTFLIKRNGSDDELIKVMCKYRVDFKFEVDQDLLSEDFIKILTDNTVKITVWPYFRQELSDLMAKMNLPNFILPLKRR